MHDTRMRGTKVVLKSLTRRIFDERFVYRPKSGLSLPLTQYFGSKQFEALMEDRLLPGMARRGLVRTEVVRRWWKELPKLPRGMSETVWIPIALELWAQEFLDSPPNHSAKFSDAGDNHQRMIHTFDLMLRGTIRRRCGDLPWCRRNIPRVYSPLWASWRRSMCRLSSHREAIVTDLGVFSGAILGLWTEASSRLPNSCRLSAGAD